MKRITFFIAFFIAGLINLQAQTDVSSGPNYKSLESKLEKSNKTIEDPKKNAVPKTWVERAKLFQEIAEVNTQNLRAGMSSTEIKLFFKDPKEVKTFQNGKEQWIYERMILDIENAVLKDWKETQVIHPKPLDEALACYNKAIELDTEGKLTKKIGENLKGLKELYQKKALNCYSIQDFACSSESFKKEVTISEMKQVNVIDTLIIYYTGLTANESKNYDDAITFFQKAADLKYKEPGLYNNLYKAYLAKGDSAKAFTSLKQGFATYPENVGILIEIINYYLITNESQAALEYLDKAKKNDPGNKSFYFADGTLYDKIGNMDKAVESYKKAMELDPNYFDAYFNLAVVYFNNAVKLTEVANSELDNKKYLDKKAIADEEFKKVIPHMEKAYDIAKASPDGAINTRSALDTLKTLYYRLKMTDQLDRVNKLLQDLK